MPKKKGIDPSAASTDTRQNRAVPAFVTLVFQCGKRHFQKATG